MRGDDNQQEGMFRVRYSPGLDFMRCRMLPACDDLSASSSTCPHRAKGRAFERCGCPFRADPRPVGKLQSLGTKDRLKALQMARDMELSGGGKLSRETAEGPVTIAGAKDQFMESLRQQGLAKATILKHQTLWRQCTAFAHRRGDAAIISTRQSSAPRFSRLVGVPSAATRTGLTRLWRMRS